MISRPVLLRKNIPHCCRFTNILKTIGIMFKAIRNIIAGLCLLYTLVTGFLKLLAPVTFVYTWWLVFFPVVAFIVYFVCLVVHETVMEMLLEDRLENMGIKTPKKRPKVTARQDS